MTVKIFGYYGHRNAGDEAFALFFEKVFGRHGVEFLHDRSQREEVDRIILGGGSVINSYFINKLPTFSMLDIIGCSFDGSDRGLQHLERLSANLGIVALRSRKDVEAARSKGINAEYFPDVVFGLKRPEPTMPFETVVKMGELPTTRSRAPQTAVVLLSDHYSVPRSRDRERSDVIEEWVDDLAVSFDEISKDYNIIFAPMSVFYDARDYAFAHRVVRRMQKPESVTLINRYLGPRIILDIISSLADVVISMRLHGLIFGMVCGKPVINIGDGQKNIDLMQDSSLEEFSVTCSGILKSSLLSKVNSSDASRGLVEAVAQRNRAAVQPLILRLRDAYPSTFARVRKRILAISK